MSPHLPLNSGGGKDFRNKVPSPFWLRTLVLQKSKNVQPDPKINSGKILPKDFYVLTATIAKSPHEDSKHPPKPG